MSESTPPHDHDHGHGHDHGHDHGHSHAPKPRAQAPKEPGLDTAQQSLSDALGVSFTVLKGLLLVLIVVYLLSGVFQVEEGNEAARLRFGERIGTYTPGWHFGLPFPIEEVVQVPVTEQRLMLDKAFWYDDPEGNGAAAAARRPLNPLTDGFLITGDANVVHVKFEVRYKINNVERYIENVGDTERAQEIVRMAAQRGIVLAMASADAKRVIDRQFAVSEAIAQAGNVLDALNSGIVIQQILVDSPSPPVQIQESAYRLVSAAEQDRGTAIQSARQSAAETLNGVAGGAHTELSTMIRAFETASGANEAELAQALRDEIDRSLTDLQMFGPPVNDPVTSYLAAMTRTAADDDSEAALQSAREAAREELLAALALAADAPREDRSGRSIGGEVASEINSARTYQTQAVARIESEYKRFSSYRELFAAQPEFTANEIWQASRTNVLADGLIETIYADTRNFRINVTGDPEVQAEILEAMLAELRQRVEDRTRELSGR
ncbi:MAG: SPFH domain-containing protein [Phycisphaerales bacterium JB063]